MKVTIIGAGYVGLVTAACLAEMGNHVVCLDADAGRVAVLQGGGVPIHEPGLAELLRRNVEAHRIEFTTELERAVKHGTLQFIAVGTPAGEDGSADLSRVLQVAEGIGAHMTDYKVVVDKSTVPVGTADRVRAAIAGALHQRGVEVAFSVVSNPEFLKEGAAVNDFMRPDRVVVGADDERAVFLMKSLYAPFVRNRDRFLVMDVRSAEFTKYAANAMLATRISFMNELAGLAEKLGADIELVRQGIGSDPRIGTHFLYAGCGYGGSCFPKDVSALISMGRGQGAEMDILKAVAGVNAAQKAVLVDKIDAGFGRDLRGRRFAVWGLAFKPGTDDVREAPSRTLIEALAERGAQIVAYDPVAMNEAQRAFGDVEGLSFAASATEALADADALVIVTEWREFRSPDFDDIRTRLKQPIVFDGRNLFEPAAMKELGFEYHCVGRGA
jgi:UDPglucose 6-dehydrogenase